MLLFVAFREFSITYVFFLFFFCLLVNDRVLSLVFNSMNCMGQGQFDRVNDKII